jgi:hypothetical protein
MPTEQDGERAWELHKQIIANEKMRRQLMFASMKAIHDLHSKKLYQVILGDEDAPWNAYLGQHEVFYSSGKVYMLDRIYRKYIQELELQPSDIYDVPFTKLATLIGVVKKDDVYEWLNKARDLTTQDFEDEIRKATGKMSYLECEHKNKVTYDICQSCGFRHKQSEEGTQS